MLPNRLPEARRDLPYLAGLALCGLLVMAVFLYQEWRMTGALNGVPLDDSWIHYRFAENLRNGRGFSFNPGVPTPGSTAPLWVILLSLVGGGFLIPSKVIGILAYLASGLLVYRLAREITGDRLLSFLGGVGTLFAGRAAWAAPSGMETVAFSALSLLALITWSGSRGKKISPWASLAFGLACLLRPEAYLLLGMTPVDFFLRNKGSPGVEGRIPIRPLLRHLLIAGLVVSPYLVFSLLTTGNPLPNTFYAKSETWTCQPGIQYTVWMSSIFLMDNPVMAILAAAGLVALGRRSRWNAEPSVRLAGAWLLTLPVFYALLATCISWNFTRYSTPLIPVMMLFAVIGTLELEKALSGWLSKWKKPAWGPKAGAPLVRLVLAEGALLGLLPALLFWAPYYGRSVADVQAMHKEIALWLSSNTLPGDTLALNDIGVIGSTAGREVIDLMGLTNPEVIQVISGKRPGEWDREMAGYLASRKPDYLVIFPNWFPGLAAQLPARQVYQVELPSREIAGLHGITVSGGGAMVVYRLDWDNRR